MTALGLIPGAFAVGGLSLMATGSGTSRTRAGRDLWSRVGGFRRMLATPSSKQRFDFSGRKELYTAYIPWAVALGCADEWAAKYRVEVGEEPPVPHYFAGAYAGTNAGAFVNSMVGDFNSTVERGDLVVQRHPELVLERRRGRRLLRRRRWRRRWRRVVVTRSRGPRSRPY